MGTTAFSTTIGYTAFSGYNHFSFNASGIAAINKTGTSTFGARDASSDVANSDPGGTGSWHYFSAYFADEAGTPAWPERFRSAQPSSKISAPPLFAVAKLPKFHCRQN